MPRPCGPQKIGDLPLFQRGKKMTRETHTENPVCDRRAEGNEQGAVSRSGQASGRRGHDVSGDTEDEKQPQ